MNSLRDHRCLAFAAAVLLSAASALAQDGSSVQTGQQLFQRTCAACHDDALAPAQGAPPLSDMRKRQITAAAVMRMIEEGGRMAMHASGWTAADRQRVAEWIAGTSLSHGDSSSGVPNRCAARPPAMDHPFKGGFWNGWGVDPANTRFQPADRARLDAADIPKLKLKWAFGFPNGTSAFSQPAVARGRVFVGS